LGNTPLGIVPARGSTSKGSAIRVEPLETTDGDDSPSWRIIAVSVFTEQTQAPRITTGALPTSHHASCCRPNRVSSKPGTHHRVRLTRRREDAKRNAVVFGTGTNRPEMGRSRGHTTAFVSREDAKTRRETQWSSSRRTNPAGDGPELGTHHSATGTTPATSTPRNDGRSGGHTTSATGSGDTPHFNRGIPHHTAETYHSTGTYRSTGIYHSTAAQHPGAGRNHLMITTSQLPASDCQLLLVCSSAPKAGHCSLRHGFHPILEHTG
jgi:hypothetical protein